MYRIIKSLNIKYKKWCIMNEIRSLDFDMQCGCLTYKQYEIDYNRLIKQYESLTTN